MKWITREYVKVDRVACPWLIKKFVDKDAEFFFVPADKVMNEAKRLGATPYDVKDFELGHHGKECSFDTSSQMMPRWCCSEKSSMEPTPTARARSRNHGHRSANKIGGHRRQSIVLSICPAVFDRHVPAHLISGIAQALAERTLTARPQLRRCAAEESDYRQCGLLPPRRKRPRRSRAAE
jgi:Chromate resistance exported protein